MLFKQTDLTYDPIQEANNILNESVYLDESEAVVSAKAIPVVENSRIGAYVVRLEDISTFAEDHGMNYENAISSIAESNDIDMDHLAVAVKETTIMANPGIVNELNNVVVTPLPETDSMYQFTEACVDAFIESGDTSYMDLLVEETTNDKHFSDLDAERKNGKIIDMIHSRAKRFEKALDFRKNKIDKNLEKNKLNLENEKSDIKKLLKIVKHYGYNTPKALIMKAIASLRIKYNQLLQNIPKDKSQQKWYQKILIVIEKTINKLGQYHNENKAFNKNPDEILRSMKNAGDAASKVIDSLTKYDRDSPEYRDAVFQLMGTYDKINKQNGARLFTLPGSGFKPYDYYDY